ncbi:hypothetical protein ACFL1O_00520 [Patescibacteria group bacterium]
MDRKINCFLCSKYLGVIRDAKLWKEGVFHVCPTCKGKISEWKRAYEEIEKIRGGDAFEAMGIKNPFKR